MSEKRVLRTIFVPKRVEMSGGWRKLVTSFVLISSSRLRWMGHGAWMRKVRKSPKCWSGYLNGPLGRAVRKWEGNIKTFLEQAEWDVVDRIHPLRIR